MSWLHYNCLNRYRFEIQPLMSISFVVKPFLRLFVFALLLIFTKKAIFSVLKRRQTERSFLKCCFLNTRKRTVRLCNCVGCSCSLTPKDCFKMKNSIIFATLHSLTSNNLNSYATPSNVEIKTKRRREERRRQRGRARKK